jgi:hypothetical protein
MKDLQLVVGTNTDSSQFDPFQEVLAELRDIKKLLEVAIRPPSPSLHMETDDEHYLSKLLPAAVGKFGTDKAFLTNELLKDPAIRALTPLSNEKVGALFSRAARQKIVVDGYSVENYGKRPTLWKVYLS